VIIIFMNKLVDVIRSVSLYVSQLMRLIR